MLVPLFYLAPVALLVLKREVSLWLLYQNNNVPTSHTCTLAIRQSPSASDPRQYTGKEVRSH